MNIHVFLPLMTMVLNLGLIGAIFSRPQRVPGRFLFIGFLSSIVIWSGAQIGISSSASAAEALRWHRLLMVGAMLYAPFFLHFTYAFAGLKSDRRILTIVYAAGVAGIGLAGAGLMVEEMVPSSAGFSPRTTPLFLAVMPMLYSGGLFAFRNVWHAHLHDPSVLVRNRARYLVVGLISAMLLGSADLAATLGIFDVHLSSLGNLIFAIAAAFALLNDRATDLRRAARRQLAHVPMLAIVAGGGAGALYAFTKVVGVTVHPYVQVAAIALFYALVSPSWHQRIHGWVDSIWYGSQLKPHKTLTKFSHEVRGVQDMQMLGATMVYLVREATGAEHVSLLEGVPGHPTLRSAASVGIDTHLEITTSHEGFRGLLAGSEHVLTLADLVSSPAWGTIPPAERASIEDSGVELFVPATFNGNLAGVLALGHRTDGSSYQQEECELLFSIAQEVAPAMENARLHDELNAQLRETRETQAHLLQAGKLATLGTLASGVAHEISNPLFSILGRVELLRADADTHFKTDKAVEYFDVIAEMSNRISDIVNALINFSRSDTARGPMPVNDLIDETLGLIERDLALTGITVHRRMDQSDPYTTGSQPRLKQALMNVLINARDAMPKGGQLTLSTAMDGPHVILTCTDTGRGMSESETLRVFDAFYTTKDTGLGAGLGLYVAQSIIDEHDGRIRIDSQPDMGTTVTITLPKAQAASDRVSQAPSDTTEVVGAPTIRPTISSRGVNR